MLQQHYVNVDSIDYTRFVYKFASSCILFSSLASSLSHLTSHLECNINKKFLVNKILKIALFDYECVGKKEMILGERQRQREIEKGDTERKGKKETANWQKQSDRYM